MSFSETYHPEHKLKLGFSPCPNDTFMFDAMVHHKIDTEGLDFEVMMEDVEALNRNAEKGIPDITKISFAAFTQLADSWQLLNGGSALGKGVGPLLVCKDNKSMESAEERLAEYRSHIANMKIAIPGMRTTANFLFSLYFPEAKNITEYIFSEIEDAVLSGHADAGVIIHENRFTYQQKGLVKICDLGELWEQETSQPIPLGGIAVKRNLPEEFKIKIDRVMRRSVEFAFANQDSGRDYVKQHAQEMEEEVRMKHIKTYVNEFSIDLGEDGKNAIRVLFQKSKDAGLIKSVPQDIFVVSQKVVL